MRKDGAGHVRSCQRRRRTGTPGGHPEGPGPGLSPLPCAPTTYPHPPTERRVLRPEPVLLNVSSAISSLPWTTGDPPAPLRLRPGLRDRPHVTSSPASRFQSPRGFHARFDPPVPVDSHPLVCKGPPLDPGGPPPFRLRTIARLGPGRDERPHCPFPTRQHQGSQHGKRIPPGYQGLGHPFLQPGTLEPGPGLFRLPSAVWRFEQPGHLLRRHELAFRERCLGDSIPVVWGPGDGKPPLR